MAVVPPEDAERHREATVWGAYVTHLAGTLSLAPGMGHPAFVYQSLKSLFFWTTEYPATKVEALRDQDAPGVEALERLAAEVADLAAQIRTLLLDPLQAGDRAAICLAATDELLDLTETRLR
jgi:hypothetical protein